jgi:transcriptional regulator with XRE-family HTH domain
MPIDSTKVEYHRVRQGKTRRQLADASGYSYSLISMIENGQTGGSVASAKAIADALGLTIDDIWRDRNAGSTASQPRVLRRAIRRP